MRTLLIILDSVGIGAAPDAADFNDAGAATLQNTSEAVESLALPVLGRMGLGNIPALIPGGRPIRGVPPARAPSASFGAMREVSRGKDTTTGHWEIAGLLIERPFHIFPAGPPSFPDELVSEFERRTGRRLIGNKAASGTAIIDELGPEQLRTGALIAYTSADSVFQIAAHEEIIPPGELYAACRVARELCVPLRVGRVIARPYVGRPGSFQRTENRRDFSFPLPAPTILEHLASAGIPVLAVGKIEDIYDHRGISKSWHTGNNRDSQARVLELVRQNAGGLVIANFIDFDMLYGHRRDPAGYARALEETDSFFGALLPLLAPGDLLLITADHGNDPTFRGTDHTREYVPLLAYQPGIAGKSLGVRHGFYDAAQTLARRFALPPMPHGISALDFPAPGLNGALHFS